MMNHQLNWDWKSDLPLLISGDWKCMFIESLIEYLIGPPTSVHYYVWSS